MYRGINRMEITITDKAAKWFEEEYPLDKGEAVQFFGKTYGKTEVHEGFSVGMGLSDPADHDILGKTEVNDRTYFAAESDDWFFTPYDLEIDFDEKNEEPIYHFNEQ